MYKVKCWGPGAVHRGAWLYHVVESGYGYLEWGVNPQSLAEPRDGTIEITRCGNMSGTKVFPEEAEAITGLHMPAAMDRLRELVHESGAE